MGIGTVALGLLCGSGLGWGPPQCVARAFLAAPFIRNAQLAEAAGGRLAMDLVRLCGASMKIARIAGDNLQAVRFCAGTSRLHAPILHSQLHQGLSDLAVEGWHVTWHAVRRRLNQAADGCATAGVLWAAHLAHCGRRAVTTFIQRRDSPHTVPDGLLPPPWPDHD